MKLKAQLLGKEHLVSLDLADDRVNVAVDDRHYNLQIRELTNGEYLLIHGAQIYRCRVSERRDASAAGQLLEVVARGRNYEISIIDPKRLRSAQSTGAHHTGAAEIVSSMPGKIVRVLVKAGDQVEAGDGVVVVEAMKMQNEMKAPKAGTVVSLKTKEGATVAAGDVLAVIE